MEALRILDIPCYHGTVLIANTNHGLPDAKLWCAALDAKFHGIGKPFAREDWDNLLGSYGAVADVPAICCAEELIEAYPEANVLLVERDLDSWERSFNDGITKAAWLPVVWFVAKVDRAFVGKIFSVVERWVPAWFGEDVHDEKGVRAAVRQKYREHYEMVRRIVPKERLLVLRLSEGLRWEPLCDFLGKEVPGVEFPRVNESEQLKVYTTGILKQGMYNAMVRAGKIGLAVGVVTLGVYLGRQWWT